MSESEYFTHDELSDAAFELLTSSVLGRFARKAQEAAARSDLRTRVEQNPAILESLVRRARDLWQQLLQMEQRGVEEVELSLLLALLSETAWREVPDLLRDIGVVDKPVVAWVAGLARLLRHTGAGNRDVSLSSIVWDRTGLDVRNDANSLAPPEIRSSDAVFDLVLPAG